MNQNFSRLVNVFRDELELCRLKKGESVVVVSQADSRPGYAEAFLAAAETLGAHALSIVFPGGKNIQVPYRGREVLSVDKFLETEPYATKSLAEADLVIDVAAEDLVHTKVRKIVIDSGGRMLMVREQIDILERMFPREHLKHRGETALAMLREAKTMRVTSEYGTDMVAKLRPNMPGFAQYGYADVPKKWDHFPGGFVACYPDFPEGKIVLYPGDYVIQINRFIETRVEMTLKEGFVTDIKGEGFDAIYLKREFEMWKDPAVYGTSHFGFGIDETAVWEALSYFNKSKADLEGQDARAFMGNFMWSTGPNIHVNRYTPCHFDFAMRDCSIYLDDELVIDRGEIKVKELLPPSENQ